MKNASKDKNDTSAMGQRIKRARMLAGLSRKNLEEKHGISVHTLQSWELGRNPINKSKAANLIEILHQYDVSCSVNWLLEGTGKGPSVLQNEFKNYPFLDEVVDNLIVSEQAIQKEIDFFKTNNPNAVVIMVSDDAMEPEYKSGDFIGGIKFIDRDKKSECVGHDCIVETAEGPCHSCGFNFIYCPCYLASMEVYKLIIPWVFTLIFPDYLKIILFFVL